MEGGPLLQDWWTKASESFVPYINITAKLDDKPDQGMLSTKGGRGFPHCVLMDSKGEVLTELRPSSEAAFTGGFRKVDLLMKARAAVAKKNNAVNKANLGLIEAVFSPKEDVFAALKKSAKNRKVDKEIKKLFESMLAAWPITKAMQETQKAIDEAMASRDRDAFDAANKARGERLLTLCLKGMTVDDDSDVFVEFWDGVLTAAIDKKADAKVKAVGLQALEKLEAHFEGNERALDHFRGQREKLNG